MSIRKHATALARRPVTHRAVIKGGAHRGREMARLAFVSQAATASRAIFHLGRRVLAKGKGLSAVQLGTLLDLAESTLAGEFMTIGVHFNVVLGVAKGAVLGEEGAVASVENVQIRVGQVGVGVDIDSAVVVANVLGHDGRAVSGIFTVKDESSPGLGRSEQLTRKFLLVVVIEGAVDVAALILILEAAVNDHDVVEAVIELPVKKFKQSVLANARQSVRLILTDEVRKLGGGRTVHVGDRLEGCICRYLGLFFGNHICRVLKHTQ